MSEYLQAVHAVTLLLATAAIAVATTRVTVDAWRGRDEDGQQLATLLLSRGATQQEERGKDDTSAVRLAQRLTARQRGEQATPTDDRRRLDLRLAPACFGAGVVIQWALRLLLGRSVSPWPLTGDGLVAAAAGVAVAYLLYARGVSLGRSDGTAYAFVALLAGLSAFTAPGS